MIALSFDCENVLDVLPFRACEIDCFGNQPTHLPDKQIENRKFFFHSSPPNCTEAKHRQAAIRLRCGESIAKQRQTPLAGQKKQNSGSIQQAAPSSAN